MKSSLEKLRRHIAACVPLLDALQPAPDADDRTRQEWAALRDAVERAVLATKNIREKTK